jgi:protein disulfide-isomerase A1
MRNGLATEVHSEQHRITLSELLMYSFSLIGVRLLTHVLKQVTNSLVKLDEERFTVMKSLGIPLMALTPAAEDDSSINLMASLAKEELAKDFFVGVMSAAQSGTKAPFITVYNVRDEATPKYDGPFEKEAILHFASLVSQPLIRQFDMSSIVSFMMVSYSLTRL